jgi:hypothetical protein
MAHRPYRRGARPIGAVSASIQRSALDAASLLHLRRDHAVEWVRSHGRNDYGSHSKFSSFPATDAGILLIPAVTGDVRVCLAPVEAHSQTPA